MKKLLMGVMVIILTLVMTLPAYADNEEKLQALQEQIENLDSKINDLNKAKQDAKSKLTNKQVEQKKVLDAQNLVDKQFNKLLTEVNSMNEDIKKMDVEIAKAEETYNKQKETLKTRLRVMYENSNSSYLDTLLESKNMSDFLSRLEIISTISKKDKELMTSLESLKMDVEYKKRLKTDEKQDKTRQALLIQNNLNDISTARSALDDQLRKLNTNVKQIEAQEDALNRKSAEIGTMLKSLKRSGGKYAGGAMQWPLPSSGNITSPFGNRYHPILKRYRMHTGIDISAPSGSPIVAANKGTVIYAGWYSEYGNTVIIDHGGDITTLYAHCSAILVAKGIYVEAGDMIAKVGSTGMSTGPHLHFEVRLNGDVTDPLSYVSY